MTQAAEKRADRAHFEAVIRLQSERQARHILGGLAVFVCFAILAIGLLPLEFKSQSLGLAWAKLLNATPIDPYYWYSDQWTGHALVHGALAFCMMGALLRQRVVTLTMAVFMTAVVFIFSLGLSCFIEFAQTYLPGRSVSGNDVSAGVIGSVAGIVAWFTAGPWLMTLWAQIRFGGRQSVMAGAVLYAVFYTLLMAFPFDIMFSLDGLATMAEKGKPFLGFATNDAGFIRDTVQSIAEVMLAMPLGLLLLRRSFMAAAIIAVVIGFGVEIFQFMLYTGQSGFVSGVMRSVGIVLGWLGGTWLLAHGRMPQLPRAFRTTARIGAVLAFIPYVILLALLDRWLQGSPPGFEQALAAIGELHWAPFYYHYAGDEVVVAVSALAQIAMFVPIGVLLWVVTPQARILPVVAVIAAVVVAVFIEFGGLFVAGNRPDPTNILLAAAGAALGVYLARAVIGWVATIFSHNPDDRSDVVPEHTTAGSMIWALIAGLCAMLALLIVIDHPGANGWLLAAGIVYVVFMQRYPKAWLIVIPAALPVLDFLPLTGRIMVDPFDALILVTLAVEILRAPPTLKDFGWRGVMAWLMIATIVAYAVAVLNGLLPLPVMDANAFTSLYSSYQTLWVGKGFVAAIALAPFFWRLVRDDPRSLLVFAYGMAIGLLLCGLVVLWERLLFTGILNFNTEYRAVGAFSTMRLGGAYLDAYFATALPFTVVLLLLHRNLSAVVFAGVLVLIGLYGTYVTFSRGPYLAVLASAIVLGLTLWVASRRLSGGITRFVVFAVIGAGLVGAAAVPFMSGSFLAKRFETVEKDKDIRFDHWARSLDMRDDDIISRLFGMGPGRFPAIYNAKHDDKVPLGQIRLGEDGGKSYVRMTAGNSVYLSQFVRVKPNRTYTLKAKVRSTNPKAVLTMPICEKWIVDSFTCVWTSLKVGDTGGAWVEIATKIRSGKLAEGQGSLGWVTTRPVKFTLYYAHAGAPIDVTDLSLVTQRGRNLIENPDFQRGLDSWYMTVDDHLPWHIKNVFVSMLFEQGYVGLILFVGLIGFVAVRLLGQVLSYDRYSAVLLASFTGFFVVGIIDSPFDTPRLVLLFYLLLFAAYYTGEAIRQNTQPSSAGNDGAGAT